MIRITHLRVFGPLISFLSFACGNTTLDLGGPDEIKASDDPSVLGTIQEEVAQLAVDGDRLYWLGSGTTRTAYANGGGHEDKAFLGPHPWALRGCDIANCAGSRVTYAPDSVDPAAGFGVREGRLAWFHLLDIAGEVGVGAISRLFICDETSTRPNALAGRAYGQYQQNAQNLPKPSGRPLAVFDARSVYFIRDANDAGHEIVSLPLDVDVSVPGVVVRPGAEVLEMAVNGDFLYWIQSTSDGARVQRAPKDGTGPAEPLVDGLRIESSTTSDESSFPAGGLAFDSTYVYFAENAEDGAIKRCPLAGCAGAPEVIAEPVRSPRALLVDGSKIYWSARTSGDPSYGFFSYALFSCTLPHCSKVTKEIDDLETPAAFIKDEQYLYAATDDLHQGFFDSRGFGFVNSLRRLQ